MSPLSPYQSRLLSFLSRQSTRWRDKTGQWWRQVQTATVWSAQILLYPAYLLFQSGRLASRQLQQEVRRNWLRLSLQAKRSAPEADRPVQVVLQVAQTLCLIDSDQTSPPRQQVSSPEGLELQGLACLLENRNLALVNAQNQVLDILTVQQQQQLAQRLSWEVSDYYYQRRQWVLSQRSLQPLLPTAKPHPNALPPIQVFQQLMGWVQQGPVASSLDLFQESGALVGAIAAPPESRELAALPSAWSPTPLPAPRVLFSGRSSEKARHDSYVRQSEPWLTLQDLFGGAAIDAPEPEAAPIAPVSPDLLATTPAGTPELAPSSPQTTELKLAQDNSKLQTVGLQAPVESSRASQPAATWIEAEVEPLGYVKHPLEYLIAWLDQVLLWVEDCLSRLGQWVQRQWPR